jgi:dolichyl-phosphate beta-glucosyltransferase
MLIPRTTEPNCFHPLRPIIAGRTSEGEIQVASTTAQPIATAACVPCITDSGEEPDIPAVLLRPSCHLEVLIPALDEARRLPHTLMRTIRYLEVQPYSSSVVVIDNGSVDQTSDLVARMRSDRVPVQLTGCAQPGKGAAVRRGFLTSRACFVGYMDADLATPIETLDVVVPLLDHYQAVVGSRRIGGAAFAKRQPVHRAVAGMAFRAMTHRVLPGFADTQCGFKFLAGNLARAVVQQMRIDGFAFDVELLWAITGMGVPVKEIPVVWSDGEGSTLRAIRDGMRATADLRRLARRRLV